VLSEREARRKWKLQIDHDDSHVWNYDKDFAIVIHGIQPAGTKASKAWQKIKTYGRGGYKSDYFGAKKVKKQNSAEGWKVKRVFADKIAA
jgi:hypothetical protein